MSGSALVSCVRQERYHRRPQALSGALSIGVDAHLRKPGESQDPRRRGRHVDYSTAHEGATIVDGHGHRTSITLVRDLHLASEGQRRMGRGESVEIQLLPAPG